MTRLFGALVILFAACFPADAQTTLNGVTTWRVDEGGRQRWATVLAVDESRLTGTVSSCGTLGGGALAASIYDGSIDNNRLRFKCRSFDGDRTITFSGVITGDEITFTYEQQASAGARTSDLPADINGMFGASAPPRFVVTRVRDAGAELAAAVNLVQKGVKVEGTIFLPASLAHIHSVMVLINSGDSWNGAAATLFPDPTFRALASTLESSLLLLRVTNISQGARMGFVANAGAGSADGLLLLLDRFAVESGHQELTSAPLLLWDHSAAGNFAASFAALHPDRTLALVRYHSGGGGLPGADMSGLSKLPALVFEAGKDQILTRADREAGRTVWDYARAAGAPWTFVLEPDATHQDPADIKKANQVLFPWITATVRRRVSADGGSLRIVSERSAFLGNNSTGDFALYDAFTGSKERASWLPDEAAARGWQAATGLRSAK